MEVVPDADAQVLTVAATDDGTARACWRPWIAYAMAWLGIGLWLGRIGAGT